MTRCPTHDTPLIDGRCIPCAMTAQINREHAAALADPEFCSPPLVVPQKTVDAMESDLAKWVEWATDGSFTSPDPSSRPKP